MKQSSFSNDYLLEKKDGFYEKLLNQIPDLIFQLTISSTNVFKFSYLNSSIISFFGIDVEELNENPIDYISKIIHSEDIDAFFQSLYFSKESTINWSHEFRIKTSGRSHLWMKVDANIEKDGEGNSVFYSRLTDITNIKNRELKVKDSEARYHFALEASGNGIWDYNIKTGQVFFSKESLEIIQLSEEDNITTNDLWDSRIHPDDYNDYLNSIELHKQGITPFFENAKRVIAKDGTYKWVLSRGKIIERDRQGNPVRIIGTHTDVSLEKEREFELRQNVEIIHEQNNRLLNFAHIVSHNLRSHTGNFKMLLNIIENEIDLITRDECFGYLKTTSNALSDTIEHLKELVDIHTRIIHKKENLNLNLFLNQTLEVLSKEIKDNNVEIVNKIGKRDTVNFNPAYLESILLNFTTNAIKYSHPDRNPKIWYSFKKEKDKSYLMIRDNGIGINLEKHGEKLFGMYKTFHKNKNARGIGLFISKNQIESMGGTIEVESKVNQGTLFKINFNEENQ